MPSGASASLQWCIYYDFHVLRTGCHVFSICRHDEGQMFGIGQCSNIAMVNSVKYLSNYAVDGQRFEKTGEQKEKKKKYISLLFMPFELLLDENFILFKYRFYINFIHNDISSYFTYTLIG